MLCTSQDPHERVPHRDPRWLVRLQLWSSVEIQSEHLLLLTLRKDLGPALLRRPTAASPVQAAAAGELFSPWMLTALHKNNLNVLPGKPSQQSPSPPSPPWAAKPLEGCVPTDSELIKSYLSSTVDTEASRLA